MFRTYGFTEIVGHFRLILVRIKNVWIDIQQPADKIAQFFIIVEQELVFFLIKRSEIFFVIFKKRTEVVSGDQCVPMQVTPVSVVGDADIFRLAFEGVRLDNGDGKCQRTVCRSNDTAVAVGLFQVILRCFDMYFRVLAEFAILLDRSQISCGKIYGCLLYTSDAADE